MNNTIKNKKKKRKKKIGRKILLLLLFVLVITGGIFAYRVHLNGGGMSGMLATMVGHDQNTKKNLPQF